MFTEVFSHCHSEMRPGENGFCKNVDHDCKSWLPFRSSIFFSQFRIAADRPEFSQIFLAVKMSVWKPQWIVLLRIGWLKHFNLLDLFLVWNYIMESQWILWDILYELTPTLLVIDFLDCSE